MMYTPFIVGICGKAGSGKDTVASMLTDSLGEIEDLRVHTQSMAEPIKSMVRALLMCLPPDEAGPYQQYFRKTKEVPLPVVMHHSPRELLQSLGTEWGRETIGKDFWINIHRARLRATARHASVLGSRLVVLVPDVRFDNEAEKLCDFVVQVVRPDVMEVAPHKSERGIGVDLIDYTVNNIKSLDYLEEVVGNKLTKEILDELSKN